MNDVLYPNIPDLVLTERLGGGAYIGLRDVEINSFNILESYNASDSYDRPEPAYVVFLDKGYYYDFSFSADVEPTDLVIYDRADRALVQNSESNDPYNTDLITDFIPSASNFYSIVLTMPEEQKGFSFSIEKRGMSLEETTAHYLDTLGVTMSEARHFIVTQAEDDPLVVFETAQQYEISNQMIAEIVGLSSDSIRGFWSIQGLDYTALDF